MIPWETHLTVVADFALLADFVVDEIRRHPIGSFVSSLDSNRKITVKRCASHAGSFGRRHIPDLQTMSIICNGRKTILHVMSTGAKVSKVGEATVVVSRHGRQIPILAGIGKRLSSREICTAYHLRWRIEILFKELKHYLHLGSYRFREFEAHRNHILMVIIAHFILKLLHPTHTIDEAKKIATESSQTVFLHELKRDLTKFHGNRIVKSRIFQTLSAITTSFPLRIAS
ncbi:MAG: hypothetical protein B6D34_09510 [Candidatus Brocadia sp. UTAMX1]|jgi:hypothetical protein|nr:MAG: hypothetical protein B6D34_09510 [Candidatus Brocadia sp. UTAMX1]